MMITARKPNLKVLGSGHLWYEDGKNSYVILFFNYGLPTLILAIYILLVAGAWKF